MNASHASCVARDVVAVPAGVRLVEQRMHAQSVGVGRRCAPSTPSGHAATGSSPSSGRHMRRISRSSSKPLPLDERPEGCIRPDGGHRDVVEAALAGALEHALEQGVGDVRVGGGDRRVLGRVERRIADEPAVGLRDPARGRTRAAPSACGRGRLNLGDPEHGAAARVQQVDHGVEVVPRRVANLDHAATVPSCSRPHRLVA